MIRAGPWPAFSFAPPASENEAMRNMIVLSAWATLLAADALPAKGQENALDFARGLTLVDVQAKSVSFEGKRGLRVTISTEAKQRLAQQKDGPPASPEQLAVIDGTDFSNGVIEAEIAGAPAPGAPPGARGFVGIAFRVRPDHRTYDAFYLRPTNGRADEQLRRNHSAQYISHPDWPWYRLRDETPGKYESYVDLEPGKWTKIRIEVQGGRARLFVHGQTQPTLIVNDLKTGVDGRGAVALWIDSGTVAHFRAVRVTRN
jgi:hypothetical protein